MVWINVTPYVRQYLLDNFGVGDEEYPDLVDIRKDKQLGPLFTTRLEKKSFRFDKRIESGANQRRSCRVPLLISHDQFIRHGWSLTLTDEAQLSGALELRCKTIMLTYISAVYYVYGNLAQCIADFYRRFHFDEFIWPTDSIRKIWQRESRLPKKQIKTDFLQEIQHFSLVQLSKNGTIAQKGLNTYEND